MADRLPSTQVPASSFRDAIFQFPLRSLAIVAVSIFAVETAIMMAMAWWLPHLSHALVMLLDGGLLTILLLPVLYWFLFRPLRMHIAAVEHAMHEIQRQAGTQFVPKVVKAFLRAELLVAPPPDGKNPVRGAIHGQEMS